MTHRFLLRWRFTMTALPKRNSVLILGEGREGPLTTALKPTGKSLYHYSLGQRDLYRSAKFLLSLLKWMLTYGFARSHLLALIDAINPTCIVTFEKTDEVGYLLDVSYARPKTKIISIQGNRFFESTHLHDHWGDGRQNVRILTWGVNTISTARDAGRLTRHMLPVGSLRASLAQSFKTPTSGPRLPWLVIMTANALAGKTEKEQLIRSQRYSTSFEQLLKHLGELSRRQKTPLIFPRDVRAKGDVEAAAMRLFTQVSGAECIFDTDYLIEFGCAVGHGWNSHLSILRSNVVIGVSSSLLWEAVSLQRPVVAVSFDDEPYHQFPAIAGSSSWVLRSPDLDSLARAIQTAQSLDEESLISRRKQFGGHVVSAIETSAAAVLCDLVSDAAEFKCFDEMITIDSLTLPYVKNWAQRL